MFNGGFVMVLWWLLPIAPVALAAMHFGQPRPPSETEKSALDILKERYAQGEIGKEEFAEKRRGIGTRADGPRQV